MSLRKKLGTASVAAVVGLGMFSVGAQAQDALSSTGSQQMAAPSADGDLAARVKQALHSDPVLFDKHIDVSVDKGKVILKGFVSSTQSLQKALHAATGAAGGHEVVNNLTIKDEGDGGHGHGG